MQTQTPEKPDTPNRITVLLLTVVFPQPVACHLAGLGVFYACNREIKPMPEKAIETITLHLPDSLKRDIQDLALLNDRSVSEWIRHELALIVYGRLAQREDAKRSGEKRG